MKRILALVTLVVLLAGCGSGDTGMDRALAVRNRLQSGGCGFDCRITADYGDKTYTFGMDCQADNSGNVAFTVTEPDSIAGITGTVSNQGGKLTFDQVALAFELLADDQVTPVSGPWILIRTLQGGYLTSCTGEDNLLHLSVNDSYEADALKLDIWLDGDDRPVRGEILYGGRRILSLEVSNFEYL